MPIEQVLGARIEDFVALADRTALAAMLREGQGRAELAFTASDSTELPMLVSVISLRIEGPAAICLIGTDLTQRKRLEAEIRQLNVDLEQRVLQRTSQLFAANRELAAEIAERQRAEEALVRAAGKRALLVELSARVVAQRRVHELLTTVADGARELTGARLSVCGHGYTGAEFRVGAASRAEGLVACPPGNVFQVEQGGVYLEVLQAGGSLRLNAAELTDHPAWWGLPDGHAPLRGLLGAPLLDGEGQPCGLASRLPNWIASSSPLPKPRHRPTAVSAVRAWG